MAWASWLQSAQLVFVLTAAGAANNNIRCIIPPSPNPPNPQFQLLNHFFCFDVFVCLFCNCCFCCNCCCCYVWQNASLLAQCKKLRQRAKTSERDATKLRAAELKKHDELKFVAKQKAQLASEVVDLREQLRDLLKRNQDNLQMSLQQSEELKIKEQQLQEQMQLAARERGSLSKEQGRTRKKKSLLGFFKKKVRHVRGCEERECVCLCLCLCVCVCVPV